MIVVVLWLCLTVPWVVLQCVIVVFSDSTHLLFMLLCVQIIIEPRHVISNNVAF